MGYELDTKLAIEKFSKIALKIRKKYGDNIGISLVDTSIIGNRQGYYMYVENVKKDNFCTLYLNYTLKEIRKFYREVTMMMQEEFIYEWQWLYYYIDDKYPTPYFYGTTEFMTDEEFRQKENFKYSYKKIDESKRVRKQ